MCAKNNHKIIQKRKSYKVLPLALKKTIVKEIEDGLITISQAMEKYQINSTSTIRNWRIEYGVSDENIVTRAKYSEEQKRVIVSQILTGQLSYNEASKKYSVRSCRIRNWCHVYKKRFNMVDQRNKQDIVVSGNSIIDSASDTKELQEALQMAKLKIAGLETMIKIAEKEFNIDIRKKYGTKQ